jgi:hypothetical protein
MIVYDGLVTGYNVFFGGRIKWSLNESYKKAKERFGIITLLPMNGERPSKGERPPKAKSSRPKAKPRRGAKASLLGRWRIPWMEQWDQDCVDAEVEGFIRFDKGGLGELHFGYVQCDLDYRETERDGEPAVEFSFEGTDEMEPCSGRGWAVLEGNRIEGEILFHRGDESAFRAQRTKGRQ